MERKREIIGTWNGVELMQGKYYAEVNGRVVGHDRKEDFWKESCGTIFNIAYCPVGKLARLPEGLSEGIIAMGDPTPWSGNYLCSIGTKEDVDFVYNELSKGKTVTWASDILKYLHSKN